MLGSALLGQAEPLLSSEAVCRPFQCLSVKMLAIEEFLVLFLDSHYGENLNGVLAASKSLLRTYQLVDHLIETLKLFLEKELGKAIKVIGAQRFIFQLFSSTVFA